MPFALEHEVATIVELFAPRAAARDVELAVAMDPALPERLVGDPGRFRQVMFNLVGNAVKFTQEGEITITADATTTTDGDGATRAAVCLEVADTGAGIPAELLESLFEPFSQLDSSQTRRHGGAGLGLAICREVLAVLGGTIRVVDSSPAGTTMAITLPGRAVPPAAATTDRPVHQPISGSARV